MSVVLTVLIVFVTIICVLIISSILLQEDKSGGGIGMIGGSSQSFFGASSSSILTKITTVLLSVFIVLSIVIAVISSSFSSQSLITESDIQKAEFIEETMPKKNKLVELPLKVLVEDFDRGVFDKIKNSSDKKFVTTLYKKEKKYYTLSKKISDVDKDKLLGILNAVGFTLESETTVVNPEE